MIRNVVAALAITLGIGLTATPADAAEPAKGNPPVEGPVIGKSHRTHRITPQGPVPDECWKLEIGGPEDHWFYGGTEICVNKRTWRNTPLGVWFSGPSLRLAEEGPLAKPVAAALTEPQSIEVQPGGHLRQDVPAGLALPNHPAVQTAERTRRNRMVSPPERSEPAEDPRFTIGLFHDVLKVLEVHGYRAPQGDSRVYAAALLALADLVRAFEGRGGAR